MWKFDMVDVTSIFKENDKPDIEIMQDVQNDLIEQVFITNKDKKQGQEQERIITNKTEITEKRTK